MMTLTPSERRVLRAKAHSLHPVVAIGQHGLTPSVLHEIDVALTAHELVKIRAFNDDRDAREALLAAVCTGLDAAPVQHIGKMLVVWRPAPAPEPAPAKPVTRRATGSRAKAPAAGAKTAGRKPRGNARTMATGGEAKRPPRGATAGPATRRRRSTTRGTDASAFAGTPGTRRLPWDDEPDARRREPRAKSTARAPRGAAAGSGRPPGKGPPRGAPRGAPDSRAPASKRPVSPRTPSKRPATPHGKSASSTSGASGARRRRKAT